MRLVFIKPWGNYKVGDIKETESKSTVRWLVDVHKVAEVEKAREIPPFVRDLDDLPVPKYYRRSPSNKMVKSPAHAKDMTEE